MELASYADALRARHTILLLHMGEDCATSVGEEGCVTSVGESVSVMSAKSVCVGGHRGISSFLENSPVKLSFAELKYHTKLPIPLPLSFFACLAGSPGYSWPFSSLRLTM